MNVIIYHIFMYFLIKIIFHFLSKEKIYHIFGGKNTIYPDIRERSDSIAIFLERQYFKNI